MWIYMPTRGLSILIDSIDRIAISCRLKFHKIYIKHIFASPFLAMCSTDATARMHAYETEQHHAGNMGEIEDSIS